MGAQIITEYNVIYCKTNDRYYLHNEKTPSDVMSKEEAKIDFSLTLCGNDEIIKDNLTYEEAKDFLSIILKLKSIPK